MMRESVLLRDLESYLYCLLLVYWFCCLVDITDNRTPDARRTVGTRRISCYWLCAAAGKKLTSVNVLMDVQLEQSKKGEPPVV